VFATPNMSEEKKEPKKYTMEEVAKHTDVEDLWVVIEGKVYNVTPFLEEHPGGDGVLMEKAGTDATEAFEDVGHSDEARSQLGNFYIGDLVSEEVPKATPKPQEEKKEEKKGEKKENAKRLTLDDVIPKQPVEKPNPTLWKQIAIPLAIIALAFLARYYLVQP